MSLRTRALDQRLEMKEGLNSLGRGYKYRGQPLTIPRAMK